MANKKDNFFQRLTKLFKSEPTIRRKIRNVDTALAAPDRTKSSGTLLFQKSMAPTYATITQNAYNLSERLMRYNDYQEMEQTPEISAALDLIADEVVPTDDRGKTLHVYSENEKIKEILEDLFYNRINIEFNGRGWARSLPVHKDTVIPLLDSRNIPIWQLAEECAAGKQHWVYSVQDDTHRIVPGKVTWCGLTRSNSELVRVWLDDETYLDTSPDHEFVLRDGQKKQAIHLLEGESLMPFYRCESSKLNGNKLDGCEEIYDPSIQRFVYTHRRVSEILEPGVLKNGRYLVTHHNDFVKRNNDSSNLMRMDSLEHILLHSNHAKTLLHTPEMVAKRLAGLQHWWKSEECKNVSRKRLKNLQARGLMKVNWDDYHSSEQAKIDNQKRSFLLKEKWANPELRSNAQRELTIKFDEKCVELFVEAIASYGKYVSPIVLGKKLINDEVFMQYFKHINSGTKRDLTKALKGHTGIEALLQKVGISSYLDLVRDRLPAIAQTSWFKRAEKKSQRMLGILPLMRENLGKKTVKLNHKVVCVEKLSHTSDVYCMTVVGPNGEHDRHNFATISNGGTVDNGVFVGNCKFGDLFLYNDVHPEHGIMHAFPIPVNEIEREENYDRDDPFAVRFRWVTLGNRTLENWEVSHFRLLGNDMFLPYGSSMIDGARKIWRQLILLEDAMLVYRVVRAPERRVIYIDVANIPPENVPMYVEEQRKNLRTTPVIDNQTGKMDLRYAPLSIEEDFLIPVRGADTGTRIDTLAGGNNSAAVEDVAYLQKKLIAALKVPRPYLGFDDVMGSKASLAQMDVRFSRTISTIQKTLISELNKIAIIHLYALGYEDEDLQNFTLHLSNPSSVAQQQKLELWRAKFEIAGTIPEGMGSRRMVQREIWGKTDEEIDELDKERLREKIFDARMEATAASGGEEGDEGGDVDLDLFGGSGGAAESGGEEGAEPAGEETPPPEQNASDEPEEEVNDDVQLLTSADDVEEPNLPIPKFTDRPVKPQNQLTRALYNRGRQRKHGASTTFMPDLAKMTGNNNRAMKDPTDSEWMKSVVSNPFGESASPRRNKLPLPPVVASMLNRMDSRIGPRPAQAAMITEDVQDVVDEGNYLQEGNVIPWDELVIESEEDKEE